MDAIAKIAFIRSHLSGQVISLNLTPIGQSAFNNPPSVMTETFKRADKIIEKDLNIHPYVHIYSRYDTLNSKMESETLQAIRKSGVVFNDMSREEFFK
jgi:hypothetical protein